MAKRTDGEKEDLRQRRSRRLLSQALLDLMGERPYREISVVDICRRAMVHRTTFYAHFEDKNALLRYALAQLQEDFREEQDAQVGREDSRTYIRTAVLRALHFLKEHKTLYFAGLADGGVEVRVMEDSLTENMVWAYHTFGPSGKDEMEVQVAAQFYTGALLAVMRWWLEKGMPIPEQDLLEMMSRLLPDELKKTR